MSRVDWNRSQSRFGNYFARRGWIHALLLLGVWLFLFPFVWMLAISVETEQELADAATIPALVKPRLAGPYVIDVGESIKPPDVTSTRWREVEPTLHKLALESIKKFSVVNQHDAAATLLVSTASARLDRRLWTSDEQSLENSFQEELSEELIADALRKSLGQIELLDFQLRTRDRRFHDLTRGDSFARRWRVESGDAKLVALDGSTALSYRFASTDDAPVVLRFDFDQLENISMADVHSAIISITGDNSWHRVDLSLDVAGERWQSDETNYLAGFDTIALRFSPPGFDDTSMRAKRWTTLRKVGPSSEPRAVLRLTIAPSSATRANFGKAIHNFDLAFKSVPFWRYIFNSIVLVLLNTIGALFSATFVGYAFARLRWPGRSIAFVLLLATMMLPSQVTMIPGFLVWRYLHWYNTLNPLWVGSFLGSAFFIFLMTQHMRTIPRDLEEAARIDGLNSLQSWYYIILPNVKPSLAAITILSFIGSWNDFLGPLVYLRDQTKFPLSLGLYGLNLMHAVDAMQFPSTMIMAGNVLMTLPVIAVFLLFQRYFVQGMSMTGMKS